MPKKLNIVHLIPNLGIGGAENVVLNLFRHIDKQKFTIKILYWENRNELAANQSINSDQIIRIKLDRVVSWNSILIIARLLREYRADLIHTHFIDADLIGLIAAKLTKIPNIISIHSYPFPRKRSHCLRYGILSALSGRILCVSKAVQKHFLSVCRANSEKVACVYNGIDLNKFSIAMVRQSPAALKESLGIEKNRIIIGNVSRLVSGKGHRCLLKAFAGVHKINPQSVLLIVGGGYLHKELVKLSQDLKIHENVVFTGPRSDIAELLNIMDIFIFPAVNEAFGLCTIEAMAMKKPIVAANHSAMHELIENNINGILVDPQDPNAISEAVIQLLKSPEIREKISIAARAKVDEFSLEKMIAKTESIYESVIKSKRNQRLRALG